MTDLPRLILASADPDERDDLRALLADAPVECFDPEIPPDSPKGGDYASRATHRARTCAEATGEMAIALCAGLEVYPLDLQPGPLTENFHEGVSDQERCQALLARLAATPIGQRITVGRAAAALAIPGDPNVAVSASIIECEIPMESRGEGGYGLDAVTQILNGKTLAELDKGDRERLGHRGKAVKPLIKRLDQA
ncbi:MAG: hypothetical protein CL897_04165 [Dehalococcoidia bacterium]|nr:hypothetical protein [Dehalococcoidia bacterium]|tara:strand:- start:1644 stop:2228 length:585 start_codon:yes stop_codon:yes gene_type:complete